MAKVQKSAGHGDVYIGVFCEETEQKQGVWLLRKEAEDLHKKLGEYLDSLPKPHPHAELMAEYAKDALETEYPWKRWEKELKSEWTTCHANPVWNVDIRYRRKQSIK